MQKYLRAVRAYGNNDYDADTGEQIMTYISREDWAGMVEAIKKDYAARTFEKADDQEWTAVVEFVSGVTEDDVDNHYPDGITRGFTLNSSDENAINYLIEKGYYDKLNITAWE